MKKIIALLSVLCLLCLAACGSSPAAGPAPEPSDTPEITVAASPEPSSAPETPAPSEEPEPVELPETEEPTEDNPALNFVGPYYCDGCSIFIEAAGASTCKATVSWSLSSSELSEWHMSGKFDTETLSFRYEDCVKTNYVYGADGTISSTETVFENGKGTISLEFYSKEELAEFARKLSGDEE